MTAVSTGTALQLCSREWDRRNGDGLFSLVLGLGLDGGGGAANSRLGRIRYIRFNFFLFLF